MLLFDVIGAYASFNKLENQRIYKYVFIYIPVVISMVNERVGTAAVHRQLSQTSMVRTNCCNCFNFYQWLTKKAYVEVRVQFRAESIPI